MDLENIQRNRLIVFLFICFLLILILAGRLYFLQIVKGEEYSKKAINNRIKIIRSKAPRGPILDCKGRFVADNTKSSIVSVLPEEMEKDPAALKLLCDILNIDAGIYYKIIKDANPRPGYPVRLATNVPLEALIKIGENRFLLKGVSVESSFIRSYPTKDISCHVTGYTREITKEAYDKAKEQGLDYKYGDYVGAAGLEKEYEEYLRGKDGGKRLEVDAGGRMVRVLKDQPHEQGSTVKLSLDLDLQKAAYSALGGHSGACVALNPNNGEILAMVSTPSYDPNIFSDGLKLRDWRKISQNKGHPMQNRFIGSYYPPGSVFKPIIGVSLFANNVSNVSTSAYCPGYFKLGSYKKGCWDVHGGVNFYSAISHSCDVWFYRESLKLEINRLYKTAKEFGLGTPTGIDLPEEYISKGRAGNFPSVEWHEKRYKQSWRKGDTLNVSIGQGDVQVSPLQIAMAIGAVANGGNVYKPHLMKEIIKNGKTIKTYQPTINSTVTGNPGDFAEVRRAMEICCESGTGRGCQIEGVRVGAKTGSAQATGGAAHAWFVAFAPVDNPQIVVATIVEHGESGAKSAAPVCKAVLKKYFGK